MIEALILAGGIIGGGLVTLLVAHLYHRRQTKNLAVQLEGQIGTLRDLLSELDRKERAAAFGREFDALFGARKIFWETINSTYKSWGKGRDVWKSTQTLVDDAPFPLGFPLDASKNLLHWAATEPDTWSGAAHHLWNFAKELYPPALEDGTQPLSVLLGDAEFEEFHKARAELSKFWNRLGKSLLHTKDISSESVTFFPSQFRLVKLLAYLETALVMRTRDLGPHKQWMFELYRWAESRAQESHE